MAYVRVRRTAGGHLETLTIETPSDRYAWTLDDVRTVLRGVAETVGIDRDQRKWGVTPSFGEKSVGAGAYEVKLQSTAAVDDRLGEVLVRQLAPGVTVESIMQVISELS